MDLKKLIHDLENRLGLRQLKILFAGDEYTGQPFLAVTNDEVVMVGDKNNVVRVDADYGVMLSGKVSLAATPDQIAVSGGYWRLNPLLLSTVPSTTPTPVPTLVKATPDLLQGKDAFKGGLDYLKSFTTFV